MAVRKKKTVWILLAAAALVGLALFLSRCGGEARPGGGETSLGIDGYSELSHYVVAEEPDVIKGALTELFGEMDATPSQDRTEISLSGSQGNYEGWYTANSFAVYRMPSELPLENGENQRQQASEIIGKLGWEAGEPVSEGTTARLYSAVFQPRRNDVPLDGFQISLWLDAEGIQRLEAVGWLHIVEAGERYDLASMLSSDAILLQFDDRFSEDARQRNRRLSRLEHPVLTYVRSEEKPDELILAWKLAFAESTEDANGEITRQSGYYLVDAEQPAVIRRVEGETNGGLVLFRDWETIVRCILGPEYTVEVGERAEGTDLAVTITGPGGSYTGVASLDESLKFSRESVSGKTAIPTDGEIQTLAKGLAEELGTVLPSEPLIYQDGARMEVYFYLGSTQNNCVYLLYDGQGLLSAELLSGTAQQPEVPDGAIGTYTVTAQQIDEGILAALQNGGLTIQCDVELPQTPDRVPSYTTEGISMDYDALIRTVFGPDCDYVLEPDAIGFHCQLNTAEGGYAVTCCPGWFAVLRTEPPQEAGTRKKGDFVKLAEEMMETPGLEVFRGPYEEAYVFSDNTTQLLYEEKADGTPISTHSYYLSGMDGSVKGTHLILRYDTCGLTQIVIRRPSRVNPTGGEHTGLLSAEKALELVKDHMEGASVDAVQVIQSIRLAYLNPGEDGGELIPVWEIPYDFYTFGGTKNEIDICTGEYTYLVDAISGQLYAYH